jgi:hypothetical protein
MSIPSTTQLAEGTFATDRGAPGRPRVEIVKHLGGGLVQIRNRNSRYLSVVPIERLRRERGGRNLDSVYEPKPCNDPSWAYGGKD